MRYALNFILNFFTSTLLLSMVSMPALAQSYNSNFDPARSNVTFYPPGGNPTQGVLPPPGDGTPSNAPTVTRGDQPGTNPSVPTGTATTSSPGPVNGTYFNQQSQSFRSRVNLLVNRGSQTVNGMSVSRGTRVALTFEPDQLTSSQQGQVEGLLGLSSGGLFTNEPYQNITVSTSTLEEIENILHPPAQSSGTTYPYPGTPASGDTLRNTPWTERSYISTDMPATGYPRYPIREVPDHPSKPIRDFSLWLVILGVVFACVQIVIAGAMMAFGHPYAGSKAIAATGGLMLLLMAFTIWKADMFNALNARGQPQGANAADSFDVRNPPVDAMDQVTGSHRYSGDMTLSQDKKTEGAQDVTHPDANLPAIPAAGTGQVVPRAGLPLRPLGSSH